MELGETKSYKGKQNNIGKKLKIHTIPSRERLDRCDRRPKKPLEAWEIWKRQVGFTENFDQQLSKAEEKYLGIELRRRREKWGSASRDESVLFAR